MKECKIVGRWVIRRLAGEPAKPAKKKDMYVKIYNLSNESTGRNLLKTYI